jgi:predicted DNA binding protein
MEVVLTVRIPDCWITEVAGMSERPIRFLRSVPDGHEGGRGLIEIRGDAELAEVVVDAIRAHPTVCHVDITQLPDGGVLGEVVTSQCAACRALTGVDCFLTSAATRPDGRVDWHIVTGGEGALQQLVERLEAEGCDVEVKSSRRPKGRRALTERQEQVLRMAIESGYYDQPKRTSIKELARRAGVAPSTLQETLQRAERKVLGAFAQRG